ncbi:MAG: CoA pyrophosphatase [Gammaproteobacteria bacterium]|nr:CoA pyrophosphatase [Gammaproteobacteria bacterium]
MLELNQNILRQVLESADSLSQTHDVAGQGDIDLKPAAVLIPLVERQVGQQLDYQLLLTRRAKHLKHHAGQISFPGGRKEKSDTNLEYTALRETFEEIGISSSQIRILGKLQPHHTITRYSMTPYVGIIKNQYTLKIDPSEVDEAFEVPFNFILNPDNHKLESADFQGQKRFYYTIQYQNYNIWGATARVLVEFSKLVHQHVRPLTS